MEKNCLWCGMVDYKLTPHFTKQELERSSTATRLGLDNTCPDGLLPNMQKVADRLEVIRMHFNAPVRVLSCYRSPAVNKAVGGSKTSAHRFALAADCTTDGVSVYDLCKWCADNIEDYDQVIFEFGNSGWMHIGFTNGTPRKQLLTATKQNGKTVYLSGLVL